MNTLKPLLTVAVLAGIGYGVYVRINSGNDAPPPGVAAGWDAAPKVQLGDASSPGGTGNSWNGGGTQITPPFGPPRGIAGAPAGRMGDAPPSAVGSAPSFGAQAGGPPGSSGVAAGSAGAMNPGATGPPSDRMPPLPGSGNPFGSAPPRDGAPPYESAPPPSVTINPEPPGARDLAPQSPGALSPTVPDRYSNPVVTGGGPGAPGGAPVVAFATIIESAKRDLEAGQLAAALRQLSVNYDNPQLAPGEQQQLNQLLDQVAGTVVYSTQHLLEPPYEVQPGERLEDIGQRYGVPWQLLAKINGIDDPQNLRPGERLKVVRGPFQAVVSLDKRQLTLLLADGSYAGRFGIGIGNEHPLREGVFAVSEKQANPVYHGRDRAIAAGDPANPLGGRWIGLGTDMAIHGTNRPENVGRTDLPGWISLSPRDAEDVYDILEVGSRVTIHR